MPDALLPGELVTYGPELLAKDTYGENSEEHYAARILGEYQALGVNAAHGDIDSAIYIAYRLGVVSAQAELLRDADRGYSSVANLNRLGTLARQQRKETWKRRGLQLAQDMRRRNPALSDLEISKRIAAIFKSTKADSGDRAPAARTIRGYLGEG
jgi:hypothetical protein